jgi:hypothetical protein
MSLSPPSIDGQIATALERAEDAVASAVGCWNPPKMGTYEMYPYQEWLHGYRAQVT